jgi:6-phospho-3-hexuloisomerase
MDVGKEYAKLYSKIIEEHREVFEKQEIESIKALMDEIKDAKRIFILGVGREGIATRSFAMRLMHLGKQVFWVWDDTTPGMYEGDLFIITDGCGQIGHLHYIVEKAKETGARVSMVTGSPEGYTAKLADTVLFVPAFVYNGTDSRVVKSVMPMGSLFEQHIFMLFDIIILLLEKDLNISGSEMEKRHRNIE